MVVTDHGFLLPAGSAHKVELPLHLTEGDACAQASGGPAQGRSDHHVLPTLPWTWANHVEMASAPEAAAFEAGTIYEHGGLSPQECVIPVLTVGLGATTAQAARIEGLAGRASGVALTLMPARPTVTAEVRLRRCRSDQRGRCAEAAVEPGEIKVLVDEEAAAEGRTVVRRARRADGAVLARTPTTVGGVR